MALGENAMPLMIEGLFDVDVNSVFFSGIYSAWNLGELKWRFSAPIFFPRFSRDL
jgi:hypothetical protein